MRLNDELWARWCWLGSLCEHADACLYDDLVFPFFLFAVGNSAAFVLPKLKEASTNAYFKKIIKRSVYIFLIGLFLNWIPFFKWDSEHLIFKDWHDVRILGVLQRIAICYLLAASLIFIFDIKNLIFITWIIIGFQLYVFKFLKWGEMRLNEFVLSKYFKEQLQSDSIFFW